MKARLDAAELCIDKSASFRQALADESASASSS